MGDRGGVKGTVESRKEEKGAVKLRIVGLHWWRRVCRLGGCFCRASQGCWSKWLLKKRKTSSRWARVG